MNINKQRGGIKAAATNKKLYGDDFYVKIGGKGKGIPRPGSGFASMTPDQRRKIGQKGGMQKEINRRAKMDQN